MSSVLFIGLAAVLCGAETCQDMADFGVSKHRLIKTLMPLPYGIPSRDVFSNVSRHLDPVAFETVFATFATAFAKSISGAVVIDGKAVRGAYKRREKATPLHLVNIWAADQRMVIGQRLAPNRNEVKGVLEALACLSLEGCMVTADALHCRADTATAILKAGADYALALKGNQPTLLRQATSSVENAVDPARAETRDVKVHDRTETRHATVVAGSRPVKSLDLAKTRPHLIRQHPDKASIRREIKKAGWDDQFLISMIAHMR